MATLPREIYIKQRKRRRDDEGEEAPAYLQIDDDDPISKRRMSANFVYQRRNTKSPRRHSPAPEPEAAPVIRTEPDRKKLPQQQQQPTPSHGPPPTKPASRPGFQPRHFHMSRASMAAAAASSSGTQSPGAGPRGVSKRSRYGPAVFVERAVRKNHSVANLAAAAAAATVPPPTPPTGLKRPGTKRLKTPAPAAAAATPSKAETDAAAAEIAAQRKPLPTLTPGDADVARLAADMDQWVLHEIGLNLKEMSQPKPASPSKFRPKAPSQRFAERNPELAAKLDRQNRGGDAAMRDADSEDASDDDYEIVVYELAPSDGPGNPADKLALIPPEQIGVLRFDSREDMELFYGNDEDDSDWVPEDDEDENAENHYTAEYPEELDSDDSEFDGRGRGGIHDPSDDEEERVAAYYRAGREFAGDYDSGDDSDRYIVEGDDESRDPDEIHQERIRRYIRQHGGN